MSSNTNTLNGKIIINLWASQKFHGFVPFHVSHKSNSRYTLCSWDTEQTVIVSHRLSLNSPHIWLRFCPTHLQGPIQIHQDDHPCLHSIRVGKFLLLKIKPGTACLHGKRAQRNYGISELLIIAKMSYFYRLKKSLKCKPGFKSCSKLYID